MMKFINKKQLIRMEDRMNKGYQDWDTVEFQATSIKDK